ncbi:transglycosylase SLT domain-containing protein [Parendozoicomonas sp. Alg238-R29]|uniref:transglycosylase SLT domain-containing protein n=1 Tax=Parendozoicomonas sp. Alg238-R29 TaxID=2993446 RepID=UPI00248E03B0|nr:transglycosylase SLT domain-containing protein [Parendozoicomonas sp. Alg238-R29]
MIWRSITLVVLLAPAFCSASFFPDTYDKTFRTQSALWLPGVDWRLLKAQCWQESRLNPLAVSPVGAQGLCQFMPGTAEEVGRQLGITVSPFAPEWSIQAAAFYMQRLRRGWSSPRPEVDRHSLAMASYNAGIGNIIKAQKACDGQLLYSEIIDCLPDITGRHSKETITYVRNIWRWFMQMVL